MQLHASQTCKPSVQIRSVRLVLQRPNRLLYRSSAYLRPCAGVSHRREDMTENEGSGFKFGLANLTPAETNNITVTFPDGAKREFAKGTTGFEIAKGISPSLAKRT